MFRVGLSIGLKEKSFECGPSPILMVSMGAGVRSGVDAWYALSELVDKSWKSYPYMEAMERPR